MEYPTKILHKNKLFFIRYQKYTSKMHNRPRFPSKIPQRPSVCRFPSHPDNVFYSSESPKSPYPLLYIPVFFCIII